jgi:hypothetical protein
MSLIERRTAFALVTPILAATLVLMACDKDKPARPEAAASAPSIEPTAGKKPAAEDDDTAPAIVAYPPGQGPPDAEAPVDRPPRTGVCSMLDTGFDGADTRSTERLIVKVKDDTIVASEYSYRGSYALDGKIENLSIPLREGKWLELEMPMTTGTKQFKLKLKSDVMDLKGTAAQDKQGSCTWEKPPEPKKKR